MILKDGLKRARKAKKLTQAALAARAGVPQSLISDIETGKRKATDALPEIATALDLAPGDLDPRYKASNAVSSPAPRDPISALVQVLVFAFLEQRAKEVPEIHPAKATPELARLLLEALERPPIVTAGLSPDQALRYRFAEIIQRYGAPTH